MGWVLAALSLVLAMAGASPSFDGPRAVRVAEAVSRRPTSQELIDAALAAGRISQEQAVVYSVFLQYGDSRLPARFMGDDRKVKESRALLTAAGAFPSLSPRARATLAPFFIPPSQPGSWASLRTTRAGQDYGSELPPLERVATKHAVFWYFTDEPEAAEAAKFVAGPFESVIWPRVTGLMGKVPRWDADEDHTFANDDGRLDILVTRRVSFSAANPYGPSSPATSCTAPVSLDLQLTDDRHQLLATLAHEFMHAVQAAFHLREPCDATRWFSEATGTWAEDYVFPSFDTEHESTLNHLNSLDKPLDLSNGKGDQDLGRWYGRYMWFFYMARRLGAPTVARAWHAAEHTTVLAAIDDATPGGFEKRWPEFARLNWNRPPADAYHRWDRVTDVPKPRSAFDVRLGGAGERSFDLATDVPYLAEYVYRFTFSDASVRSASFANPLALEPRQPPNAGASVQALVRIGGRWQVEDWTHRPTRAFCRDEVDERIEELVVVVSNSDFEDKSARLEAPLPTRLVATNVGCWRWKGTVVATYKSDSIEETLSTSVTFERVHLRGQPDYVASTIFHATEGQITWSHSGAVGNCSGSGHGTLPTDSGDSLEIGNYLPDLAVVPFRHVVGNGNPGDTFVIEYACTDSSFPFEVSGPSVGWFVPGGFVPISADGTHLDGTASDSVDGEHMTWEWHFVALRE